MLGQHRPTSKTPFQWHFALQADDGPLIVVFGSPLPSSTKKKNCQSWTPSDKTFLYHGLNINEIYFTS